MREVITFFFLVLIVLYAVAEPDIQAQILIHVKAAWKLLIGKV